jgi:hypothetical protein
VHYFPDASPYFKQTHNPIPDARRDKTFVVENSGRFAESAVWAVPVAFEEVSRTVRDAVAARLGIEYAGAHRFGRPPLGESLSTELVSRPYSDALDLAAWKALDGSSTLHVAIVSARSLGQTGVTIVQAYRSDHCRSWADREFHTGIQFPFPMRVDNFRSVVTSTETEFLGAVLKTRAIGPVFSEPAWRQWLDQERLKSLAARAYEQGPV